MCGVVISASQPWGIGIKPDTPIFVPFNGITMALLKTVNLLNRFNRMQKKGSKRLRGHRCEKSYQIVWDDLGYNIIKG